MLRVEEAEQQRDRDRLDAERLERGDQRLDLFLRKWRDDGAVGADPLGDLEPPVTRNERGRRVLEQVVELRAR